MTIEERVDSICKWNNPGLRSLVIEEMKAAVEAERERFIRIMRDEIGEAQFNNPFSREGETLRRIAAKITTNLPLALSQRSSEKPDKASDGNE